jgi:hypothetical protein
MALPPAGLMLPLLAQGTAGTDPQGLWDVLRHDVIPVASAYIVLLALLVTYHLATRRSAGGPSPGRKRPRTRSSSGAHPGWGDLVRYVAGTAAGGYLFFLSIVVVFYFVLGGEDPEFIRQAFVEGSILAFGLVVPAFLVLSFLSGLRSRQRQTKP